MDTGRSETVGAKPGAKMAISVSLMARITVVSTMILLT